MPERAVAAYLARGRLLIVSKERSQRIKTWNVRQLAESYKSQSLRPILEGSSLGTRGARAVAWALVRVKSLEPRESRIWSPVELAKYQNLVDKLVYISPFISAIATKPKIQRKKRIKKNGLASLSIMRPPQPSEIESVKIKFAQIIYGIDDH